MFFDARAAKLLQPGQHLVIDGCMGLRLVATATRKTWTYRYKADDGRMKQVAFGQWPALAAAWAAAQWQALREQRASGADPGLQRRQAKRSAQDLPDPLTTTVRDVVADYIADHIEANRKAAGASAARKALETFLDEEPELAALPAAGLTRSHAFDALSRRAHKPTAAAKLRSMLGSAWDLALDAGRLQGDVPNWWRMVLKGRLKSKGKIVGGKHVGQQRRVLPGVEVGQLLAWAPNMHELGRDVLTMYLWTCLRGVEIVSLRPEHVGKEADGTWWTVPKELTKNARFENAQDLRVPLVGRALEVVERRLAAVGESGWLFEGVSGRQYLQKDFSTYINSLQPDSAKVKGRQGAGLVLPVTGWSPHNLRRTSRTLLASIGSSNEVAEAILGHMPKDIVGIYNSYTYDKERRVWLTKLSKHLEQLAKAH